MTTTSEAENLSESRSLAPIDSTHSATPFLYEGNVLGTLTESMVPRFFGALTDTDRLPTKKFKLADLTAMQNRVNHQKVDAIREAMNKAFNPDQPRDEKGRWGSGISVSVYSPSADDAGIDLPSASVPASGPLKMYHVTTTDSAKSILENGFDKDAPNQIQGFESSVQGVYGWATPERAKMEIGRFAEMGVEPDDFAILEIEVPRGEFGKLMPDEDFSLDSGEWKGSYEQLQSVAYEGSAPASWVKGISGSQAAMDAVGVKAPGGSDFKLPPAKTPTAAKRIANLPERNRRVLSEIVRDGNFNMSVNDIKQQYGVSDLDSREVESISRLAYGFRNKSVEKAIKLPLVVCLNGKCYIADGHHRATALWLAGEEELEAHFKDLDEMTDAVKSEDLVEVIKVDEEHRVVYGWASVITEKGQPVVDTQGDIISPEELLSATTEYMKGARIAKHNHKGDQIGEVLHSFPMTLEIAKSLGIDTKGREGWLTGMFIKSDEHWASAKSGKLKAFSIGARAVRVPVG